MRWAARNCSTLTFDRPMWRIKPSGRRSASVPIWSSNGASVAAVQVVEVDAVNPETARTQVCALAQILAVADCPEVRVLRAAADESALRRDHQPRGIGVQRVADQQLVGMRAVGIRRIDEGHAGVDDLPEQCDASVPLGELTPYAGTGQAHGAKPQPADFQIGTDSDRGAAPPAW
jgi:hypothetical protein